jgi:hypothetical protein
MHRSDQLVDVAPGCPNDAHDADRTCTRRTSVSREHTKMPGGLWVVWRSMDAALKSTNLEILGQAAHEAMPLFKVEIKVFAVLILFLQARHLLCATTCVDAFVNQWVSKRRSETVGERVGESASEWASDGARSACVRVHARVSASE